jgi:hypothetical protein
MRATGKNLLWVAKQHGHSVSTMLTTCAAWTEGATDADVEAIKRAMESRPRAAQIVVNASVVDPLASPEFGTGSRPFKRQRMYHATFEPTDEEIEINNLPRIK